MGVMVVGFAYVPFRVWLGFRVQGSGFGVWGLGSGLQGLGAAKPRGRTETFH